MRERQHHFAAGRLVAMLQTLQKYDGTIQAQQICRRESPELLNTSIGIARPSCDLPMMRTCTIAALFLQCVDEVHHFLRAK